MIIKNNQITRIANIFSRVIIPQTASVQTIVSITEVLEKLPTIEKTSIEATKKLFASYGVELVDNRFEFTDHKDADEIKKKYIELSEVETTIPVTFDKGAYAQLASGLSGSDVLFLKTILS